MLSRIFKYSVKNSLRNKFLSLSSILVLTLLMFFVNVLFVLEGVSNTLINTINSKLTISLYVSDLYTKTSLEITDFMEDIGKLNKEVTVEYKTKDDILNEMRIKEPDLVKILEKTNPLPDTIVLSGIPITDYRKIDELIKSRLYLLASDENQDDYFANYSTQYKKIDEITSVLGVLKMGLNIIIVIFIISIAIIIYSVIGNFIYYYRDEIYITKLVGGSNVFIYGPFVIQGMMYSFLAFIFNLIILIILLENLNILLDINYNFAISYIYLFIECILFLIIGGLSGLFSSKKYIKQ